MARYAGRSAAGASSPSTPDADGPPPLIPVSETQSSIGLDPPPPNPEDELTVPHTVSTTSSPPPPLVTDGRGRVVWTSADSTSSLDISPDSPGPSVNTAAVPLAEPALPVLAPTTSPNTSSRLRTAGSPSSNAKSAPNPAVTVPTELRTDTRAGVAEAPSQGESELVASSLLQHHDGDAGRE